MDVNKLKYVVGKAEKDSPAIIRFFGSVDSYSTECFNEEFLWLQNYVKPSKIIVLINSDGGSVLYGMSTFSIIQSCPIEVDCIIEGMAASMGSVIWTAGDHLYMHDYSILMIHNPFMGCCDSEDENVKNMINAFRTQIETIYVKRFGLSKEKVREIMDGEGEADGTYFNAKDAVKAGIIPQEHVIKTSKAVCEKVKNQIEGITNVAAIRDIMASIAEEVDENKLLSEVAAIRKQNSETKEHQVMENKNNIQFDAVAAQLGISGENAIASVTTRITELLNSETELKNVKGQLSELQIQFKGKEAEAKNLQEKLTDVEASLKKYQDAEKAAFAAEINALVEDAIKAGKIEASAKEQWIAMAQANVEMVKTTLASIPARVVITDEIAGDAENKQHTEEALKTAEEKMAEKVKAVVGDVTLKTF